MTPTGARLTQSDSDQQADAAGKLFRLEWRHGADDPTFVANFEVTYTGGGETIGPFLVSPTDNLTDVQTHTIYERRSDPDDPDADVDMDTLKPGTAYTVSIVALNIYNTRSPIATTTLTTAARKLPGPPTNLAVAKTNDGAIALTWEVTWDEPATNPDITAGYRITEEAKPPDMDDILALTNVRTQGRSFELVKVFSSTQETNQLKADTTYTISVWGVSNDGYAGTAATIDLATGPSALLPMPMLSVAYTQRTTPTNPLDGTVQFTWTTTYTDRVDWVLNIGMGTPADDVYTNRLIPLASAVRSHTIVVNPNADRLSNQLAANTTYPISLTMRTRDGLEVSAGLTIDTANTNHPGP